MEKVFVVKVKGKPGVMLLAELGLEDASNIVFDKDGRKKVYPYERFDIASEEEISLDSDALTPAQRESYAVYWSTGPGVDDDDGELERLMTIAKRHPFRQGAERRGGNMFRKPSSCEFDLLTEYLLTWLEIAVDEDVIGNIGSYAGREWLYSSVPSARAWNEEIMFRVHADSRAVGVARFLAFVHSCGGARNVRAVRRGGRIWLVSHLDELNVFDSGSYFYFSQNC